MDDRRARGAVFTPPEIAASLAGAALAGRAAPATVCDPAAGEGALLAAVAAMSSARLLAADVHPGSVASGRTRLPSASWAEGDALRHGLCLWDDAPSGGVDLVVGNPPFRNQLARATAHTPEERERMRDRFGSVAAGYADTAASFLVAACEMAAPGGRVAMIMPLSFLTARDAAPARRRVLELATPAGIWVAGERVFPDADVQVCALLLDRSPAHESSSVRRWSGPTWVERRSVDVAPGELRRASTWGHLVSDLLTDLPLVELDPGRPLRDIATATAGFRGQFYGLAPHVTEVDGPVAGRRDGMAPMVTCGLIDPGRVSWGVGPTRIAGRTWERPAISPGRLPDGAMLRRWVEERRRPKVLVATQTKVLEAAADPTGEWIPSTPVIAVHAEGEALWRVLAVLLAPPISAWALRHFGGAALSPGAVKLSARQVLDLPLPPDDGAWAEAASLLSRSHHVGRGGVPGDAVVSAAEVTTRAYRTDPSVHAWWLDRVAPRLAAAVRAPVASS